MKIRYRYRSAKTGWFVTAKYAKRYPRTTVRERVKALASQPNHNPNQGI